MQSQLQLPSHWAAALLLTMVSYSRADIITQDIVYQVDGDSHTGYLAYDDATATPRPGVLVVHEWWGLGPYEKRRTQMLAALGYAAFAVDMYGTGKLTANPEQAKAWMQAANTDVEWWRSTAMEGVEILKTRGAVDSKRIAAIGYCFGGGTVLQLAYGKADLTGVVSFHGSLPVIEDPNTDIKAKILVLHGHADPFVPKAAVERFQASLEETKADWQMISYGGVVHSFTNPEADNRGMAALKYDANADRRSWLAMQAFLREVLGQ